MLVASSFEAGQMSRSFVTTFSGSFIFALSSSFIFSASSYSSFEKCSQYPRLSPSYWLTSFLLLRRCLTSGMLMYLAFIIHSRQFSSGGQGWREPAYTFHRPLLSQGKRFPADRKSSQ